MPYAQGYAPGEPDFGWSLQQAQNRLLAHIGNAQPSSLPKAPWNYYLTGIYAAAQKTLPNVGWDPERAVELAFRGVEPRIDDNLRTLWDDNAHWDREYRLRAWLPTPGFGGKYGCPGSGPLAASCVNQVQDTYKKVCAAPVREAYLTAPSAFDLNGPGRMLDQVKENCLSWIKPQIDRALALDATLGEDTAMLNQQLCGHLEPRSAQMQGCLQQVQDAWGQCVTQAFDAGHGPDAAHACLANFSRNQRILRAGSERIEETPRPVSAPSANTPIRIGAPAAGQAQRTERVEERPEPVSAPSANTPIRIGAPATGQPQRTRPAPVSAPRRPPTPARVPAAPPPARQPIRLRGQATPACPDGQVQLRRRDGSRQCVPAGTAGKP